MPVRHLVYRHGMCRPLLLLPLCSLLLCQCKSTRTVTGEGLHGANIAEGEGALLKKFAGNFKPEDASWYSAAGETDQKKKGKERQESKRSSFESQVAKTRKEDIFTKAARWDQRSDYQKEYAGNTKKKGFAWPWSKKFNTPENHLDTTYKNALPTPSEADRKARDADQTSRDAEREFATSDFANKKDEVKHSTYWPAEKPSAHRTPLMLDDRDKPRKDADSSWSLSDVRKLLNKS